MQAALLSSVKMDRRTPACVLERVRRIGAIALDPCTSADNPCGAVYFFAPESVDGLAASWITSGLIYVNPPYGRDIARWVEKFAEESAQWRVEIVLLTPSCTDTRWWRMAWGASHAAAFWRGRLTFEGAPAPAPFPSCLFYVGRWPHRFAEAFEDVALVVDGGRA